MSDNYFLSIAKNPPIKLVEYNYNNINSTQLNIQPLKLSILKKNNQNKTERCQDLYLRGYETSKILHRLYILENNLNHPEFQKILIKNKGKLIREDVLVSNKFYTIKLSNPYIDKKQKSKINNQNPLFGDLIIQVKDYKRDSFTSYLIKNYNLNQFKQALFNKLNVYWQRMTMVEDFIKSTQALLTGNNNLMLTNKKLNLLNNFLHTFTDKEKKYKLHLFLNVSVQDKLRIDYAFMEKGQSKSIDYGTVLNMSRNNQLLQLDNYNLDKEKTKILFAKIADKINKILYNAKNKLKENDLEFFDSETLFDIKNFIGMFALSMVYGKNNDVSTGLHRQLTYLASINPKFKDILSGKDKNFNLALRKQSNNYEKEEEINEIELKDKIYEYLGDNFDNNDINNEDDDMEMDNNNVFHKVVNDLSF